MTEDKRPVEDVTSTAAFRRRYTATNLANAYLNGDVDGILMEQTLTDPGIKGVRYITPAEAVADVAMRYPQPDLDVEWDRLVRHISAELLYQIHKQMPSWLGFGIEYPKEAA